MYTYTYTVNVLNYFFLICLIALKIVQNRHMKRQSMQTKNVEKKSL